ncbi:alpha/beta-hydrolase [Aaosphaeria arxii CBS 175.79]|uniref:Alpha/beta-hydrolase n=1 Tax=Aaosphaeria arxii CBS 175.79 TaxID=1450172 RepID=A0A6A5XKF8_9PLEO|nr:alpha/beta-hydrolase [Aaosphaeria arxii CBS 175.79]KAF2013433.1 alpha/beta-hydrolase [Aaosphaeria arxii CBS 175.79]
MTFLNAITRYLTLSLSTGENIFYREAGDVNAPTVLLLHGFPSSSNQFRYLIPILATKYHVLAPDLPSYGFTTVTDSYNYTFDNLATTISTWLTNLPTPPQKYSIYIFDYGAPVGLRLALEHPERISSIITQNGNAYVEGLGPFWESFKPFWANRTTETEAPIRPNVELPVTKFQYEDGTPDLQRVDPASYTFDQALLDRPGIKDIQIDLFYDYQNNLPLYPKFQQFFREKQVPLLAVWGKNDVIFVPPGAEAFKRDLPNAEVELWDAGHFVSDTYAPELGERILKFFKDHSI